MKFIFNRKLLVSFFSPRAFSLQFCRRKTFKLNFQLSISLHKKSQSSFGLSRNLELKIERIINGKGKLFIDNNFQGKRKFVDNATK
jgi:hypothetical protein